MVVTSLRPGRPTVADLARDCVGPIVSFTTSADPSKALTVLAKWYSEFDDEHTFEGNTVDVAVSFKF